ncbi:MAG: sulfatase [Akkermansia sp.]
MRSQLYSILLLGLMSFIPCSFAISPQTTSQKPNIILFLVDDMGWQDTSLPFWHDQQGKPVKTFLNNRYRTPNMEKLASQGMKFTNAYANPICSPSRVSLISGMSAARHRVTNWTLNRDQSTDAGDPRIKASPDWNVNGIQPAGTQMKGKTTIPLTRAPLNYSMAKPFVTATSLPELLKQQGYTTIHCGKAHFGTKDTPGADPINFGFDYNIAGTEIGGPADYRGSQKYGQGAFHIKGLDENNYYKDDVFLTEALTQEALKRLDQIRDTPQEAKKPFYLYMAHYAIHCPFDQRGYDKRFAENYKDPHDNHPWSDNEKRYSALIEGMDKSLGDIMSYLKKNKLDKNTILIFMSDNGGLANQGRLGDKLANYPLSCGKGSLREGGIREPMIVKWQGITKPASTCTTPVIIEDFFPSILAMAKANKPQTTQQIDGQSFVPLLLGKQSKKTRPLLFHSPNIWIGCQGDDNNYAPATALRFGDWKLIYSHPTQRFELFNLKDDISEQHNLVDQQVDKAKYLATLMTKMLKERKALMPLYKTNNPFGLKEGTPVPWPDQAFLAKSKKK